MCTLTWLGRPGMLDVFFNRDERRTRGMAAGPRVRAGAARPFVAPEDGDHGGTWISVNSAGLVLALLNGYAPGEDAAPGPFTSRGRLVLALAPSASAAEVRARLEHRYLRGFRSFWLAALAPDEPAILARWEAGRLVVEPLADDRRPLCSSAFQTADVRASRARVFEAQRQGDPIARHLHYHRSHEPERGPHSVCMHRPDAETVSFSWVQIDREVARFHYVPHAPCAGRLDSPPVVLARATQ